MIAGPSKGLQISGILAEIASYSSPVPSATQLARYARHLQGLPAVSASKAATCKRQTLTGRSTQVSDRIIHVTDASFEQDVIKADHPVLVDYWAEWCGPCKMIAPVLDEIAAEYQGRLSVAKLNIDQNPDTPPRYGIRGIPTLMLFKEGEVEATKVGAISKSQLTAFIDSNL